MSEVIFDMAKGVFEKIRWMQSQQDGGLYHELENKVVVLKNLLSETEEKGAANLLIQPWGGLLGDAVYDLDDLIDDILTDLRRRPVDAELSMICEVCLPVLGYHTKFAPKISLIETRIEKTLAVAEKSLRNLPKETPLSKREQTHSFVDKHAVLGRDEEKEKIINILDSEHVEDWSVCVIPIVGLGGIGKTTLAQLVYNDSWVKEVFQMRLWVHFPDVFDLKGIVERALANATGSWIEGLDLDNLQNRLRECLSRKRFLLVLDDVWSMDYVRWLELKKIFAGGAIIVTTKSKRVAEITGTVPPLVLQGLSISASWSLFGEVAAVGEDWRHENQDIAEQIMKKCDGIPLALKILGSMLFKKPKDELLSTLESELSSKHIMETILPSLSWSFYHLPAHLKRCFAFCSIFPRGYDINVQELVLLWVAEGFIRSSDSTERLEDIGLAYFEELSSRFFFQDVQKDRLGNYVQCKMHDLMRDLATFMAGEETEQCNSIAVNIKIKTRHVSVEFGSDLDIPWEVPTSLLQVKRLRTLLLMTEPRPSTFQTSSRFEIEEAQLDAIFRNLGRLMVLDLHQFKIRRIPRSIKFLEHLRHLNLSYNDSIKRLPKCIVNLLNLQLLNLSYCVKLEELRGNFGRLVNLTHLVLEGCWKLTHMPRGLGHLTRLQTLTWFIVPSYTSDHVGGLSELKQLNSLRGRLEIRNLSSLKGDGCANMEKKQHLQLLSLHWNREFTDVGNLDSQFDEKILDNLWPHKNLREFYIYDYAGLRFPRNFSKFTKLITIWIQDCRTCQCLPHLHKLPVLTTLVIRGLNNLEYIDYEASRQGSKFFPSLKTLWLAKCPKLECLFKESDGRPVIVPQFPCLSSLRIQDCQNMRYMPRFPSLYDLWLENSRTELLNMHVTPHLVRLSNLMKLCIEKIGDLYSLPEEWSQILICLQELVICDCPDFSKFPESMPQISSLKVLAIRECPRLKVACRGKNASDWPLVSHIPDILIDEKYIQRNAQYMLEDEDPSLHTGGI